LAAAQDTGVADKLEAAMVSIRQEYDGKLTHLERRVSLAPDSFGDGLSRAQAVQAAHATADARAVAAQETLVAHQEQVGSE
jgi:hypothetical protein